MVTAYNVTCIRAEYIQTLPKVMLNAARKDPIVCTLHNATVEQNIKASLINPNTLTSYMTNWTQRNCTIRPLMQT